MGNCCVGALVALLLAFSTFAQQSATKTKPREGKQSGASQQPDVKNLLESKIRAEWEAWKHKDMKAYADLLADDFTAVESDRGGERDKQHAVREVGQGLVHDYLLQLFKFQQVSPDAVFVTYEVHIQFPPKAQVRFARLYVGELWVKRNGQWKTLHYQETPVK